MTDRNAPGWLARLTGWLLMAAAACMLLAVPVLLAYQALLWLRDGTWTVIEIRALWQALGWPEPAFAWIGVQRIVSFLFRQELAFGLLGGSYLLGWIGHELANPK